MPDSLAEAKRRLRLEAAARRRALPAESREAASSAIERHLLAMPELARAARVIGYWALPDEASITGVLRAVLAERRPLLLPRIEASGELAFARVRDLGALAIGRHGILEPRDGAPEAPGSRDLVLVPGVAFDAVGGRIGRGAGFYDRALPTGSDAPRSFGVGFRCQLVECVPMESHDRFLDGVVTEDGVIRVAPRDRLRDPG